MLIFSELIREHTQGLLNKLEETIQEFSDIDTELYDLMGISSILKLSELQERSQNLLNKINTNIKNFMRALEQHRENLTPELNEYLQTIKIKLEIQYYTLQCQYLNETITFYNDNENILSPELTEHILKHISIFSKTIEQLSWPDDQIASLELQIGKILERINQTEQAFIWFSTASQHGSKEALSKAEALKSEYEPVTDEKITNFASAIN